MVGLGCVLPRPTKKFSPQNGEKIEGKKWDKKLLWSVFGWMGRKENKWWDRGLFSPDPPKSFLFKMERKLKGEIRHHFWTKMPMYNCTFTPVTLIFFLRCLPPFFFFFLLLFRCDFFLWTWILFFNKFRWLIFFFWLFITFWVLIGHHFF